jgi:hypothetical protein
MLDTIFQVCMITQHFTFGHIFEKADNMRNNLIVLQKSNLLYII